MIRAVGAISAVLLLSGCVSTSVTALNGHAGATAVSPDTVAIYRTADQVPRRYREVALLNSEGDVDFTTPAQMHQSMRVAAAKLGANGVILGEIVNPSSGAQVASWVFGTPANRRSQAVAIIVEPAAP